MGALLPADWLVRVADGKDVDGSKPADYRVVGKRSVRDEAERHWDYLRSLWRELREQLPPAPEAATPADPTGIAIAGWLLPLFTELGSGELTAVGAAGIPSDDGAKTFPISHRWAGVPIHLAPWQSSLDKRVAGAVPPQSLVQECLNRTERHLWGVLSNGRQLRLLRDSSALATSSVVLCPEVSREDLVGVGKRICELVRGLRVSVSEAGHAGVIGDLTVSIGAATYPEFGHDTDERACTAVQKAIRRAITRITTANPVLGRELDDTVVTGLHCCYLPRSTQD